MLETADLNEDARLVSYLPLSHIAGMLFDLVIPVIIGCCCYFAKPDALQGTLVETLQWARPNVFIGVPRVWEKMEEKMKALGASKGKLL